MVLFNNLKITEFYPYRTAIVTGVYVAEDTSISEIVKEFLEDNGYKFDNHICFTTNNGLAFMYSSKCLYIGTKVIKRNW